MKKSALIRLTQLPVIEEQLRVIKESWEQNAKDAAAMPCNEETIQDVKKARAEMRKEHDEVNARKKAVNAQYMAPWLKVEEIFKDCVEDAYTRADAIYKEKIAAVEDAQKAECEKKCREYFTELCAVHGVEWLRYEQAGLKISLTEAKKKTPSCHFQYLNNFAFRVACDVDAISDDAELMTEYKVNGLNLAKAQKTIRDRREAAEVERKAANERAERQKREAEAVAKVEAAVPGMAPPVTVEAPKEEKLLTVTFRATGTRAQLIKVREFMKQEGISYE